MSSTKEADVEVRQGESVADTSRRNALRVLGTAAASIGGVCAFGAEDSRVKAKDLTREAQVEVDPVSKETRSVLIQGFLTKEDETSIWVNDPSGYLIIGKKDIVKQAEWAGVPADSRGKPVKIYVRDGAELLDVNRITMRFYDQPLLLIEEQPLSKGIDELDFKARSRLQELGFSDENVNLACTSGVTRHCPSICTGPGGIRFPCSTVCDSGCD